MLEVVQVPLFRDNYSYIIHEQETGETAVVDPGAAEPIERVLRKRSWGLDAVWITHHHADHTGGNRALKARYGCRVFAPRGEAARIPSADELVSEGAELSLGRYPFQVLDVPGHTLGHLAYILQLEPESLFWAFTGDCLFSLGCGRLFEGSARDLWDSLTKLAALHPDTWIYCAHEYTEGNLAFALTVEPDNAALQLRAEEIGRLRTRNRPTVPSRLADELACNPFLRCGVKEQLLSIRDRFPGWVGREPTPVEILQFLRNEKDCFCV